MDKNNTVSNITVGNPVNKSMDSFGNNVKGFNKPSGNTKGYKESSQFSKDKSFGPSAQSVDDEGMTHVSNFDGHHIKVLAPQNSHAGLQPSGEFGKQFSAEHGGGASVNLGADNVG